jgi:outer membrane PBP1 activator LpoA protein
LNIHKYDVLRDTWIYQEIRQQVQEEERQHYLLEQRLILLKIVQARFPRIKPLVKQIAERLNEPAQLGSLILKVSTALTEKQARQSLQEFTAEYDKHII